MSFLAPFLVALTSAAPVAQDDAEKALATALARKLVVDFLVDNEEIEVETERAKGKAKAVEPQENAKVELEDLLVGEGMASATIVLKAPFSFAGKLKQGEEWAPVSGVADLELKIETSAVISQIGRDVEIRATVDEIQCEVGEVRELEPHDLSGAKQIVEEVFRKNVEKLRKLINDWLEEHAVDPNETVDLAAA